MSAELSEIESLADAHDWLAAERFARERYAGAKSDIDRRVWGLQVLGSCFLNEREGGEEARYVRSIAMARELSLEFAGDAEVLAWCAWVHNIYGFTEYGPDHATVTDLVVSALKVDPQHPLAQWLAATVPEIAAGPLHNLGRLFAVIALQPGHRHAQSLAMESAFELGLVALARQVAQDILNGPPWSVSELGVWNSYANDVVYGACDDEETRLRAREVLAH